MRYEVVEEKEYGGYAIVDTATNTVIFRGSDKNMCDAIVDRANDK
jgi:hypothetical protein